MEHNKPSQRAPGEEHRWLQPKVSGNEAKGRRGSQCILFGSQQVEYENIVLADQQNAVLHKYNHLDDKTKELEAAKSLYKLAFLSS